MVTEFKCQVSETIFERIFQRAVEDKDYLAFIGVDCNNPDNEKVRERLLEIYEVKQSKYDIDKPISR